MGLKPHQNFFQNFFPKIFEQIWSLEEFKVNLAQTCDEQMLKISSQYLEWFQNYSHLTEKLWQLPAYICKNQPISYQLSQGITRIFQLNDYNSENSQDIHLKFSAFVHHMPGLN